jgi:hypothetical protein
MQANPASSASTGRSCHASTDAAGSATVHAHHGHGHALGTPARLATSATVHCLTGCAIGELVGLAIGVTLGIGVWPTMILATVLAYVSGFALGLRPLVRRGMSVVQAFRTIWLGEAISIGVMELAMNFTDYHMGGIAAASVLEPMFWGGFAVALPAGFLAAWPVNWWLLRREIKKPCH